MICVRQIHALMQNEKFYQDVIHEPIFTDGVEPQKFIDNHIDRIITSIRTCLHIL